MRLTFRVYPHIMFKTCLTISMFMLYVSLIGCGTTGPLYIPEQRYPLPQDDAQATPDSTPDNLPTKK